ncbi:hypothetical protein KL909_003438 [Ogataea angusta]|nr:hypothetical protein KL909_003438 [Ogataea angusta]KAG7837933.1 hypothetical protein KL943_000009 [Ogataea angusta]
MISAMAAVVAYNNDYISGICGKDVYQWLKYMTAFASVRQYYQLWQSRLCNWWYWVHIRIAQRTLRAAGYGVFFGDGDPRNTAAPLAGPVQTNNRAELSAIKQALETILEEFEFGNGEQYQILTDSEYCVKCIFVWSKTWQKNGWKNSKKQPVANRDLIESILGLIDRINEEYARHGFGTLTVDWVRGHANNHGNEMADALAREGATMERK